MPEITRLGRTLAAWRSEFLAASTIPTSPTDPPRNLNLKIKNTKRAARGYRSLLNYSLRLLLNYDLISDDQVTTQIRTRAPRMVTYNRISEDIV